MMRRWGSIVALIPAAAGIISCAILRGNAEADPLLVFSLEGRRSDAVFAAGILLSGLLLAVILPALSVARRQEARLAAQQAGAIQERRRFLRRLDHELKNPLTAILAGLAGLESSEVGPAQGDTVAKVTAQAKRLSRLTADLRKLADLETIPIEWVEVDVSQVVKDVSAALQEHPDTPQRRVTVTVPSAPWPLPAVRGDQDLLFLAIYNLAENALKFSRPGDAVEIRAREDRGSVIVEVADTGPGIAPEDVLYMWEELYRGQAVQAVSGSGMGLALVKAVAERHRGSVELATRQGQGTVIAIHLPAVTKP